MTRILLSATLCLLVGCGRGATDDYAEAVPADLTALSLEISGDSDEGAALTAPEVQRQALNGGPEGLELARERIKALNGAVRSVVTPIAELVASQGGQLQRGEVAVFGPKVRNGVSYTLTVKKLAVGHFAWKLEGTAAGSTTAVLVAAGTLNKGALPHRGRGSIGIDFDALRTLDSSTKPAGKLLCGFAHVTDTKTLVYALKNFTPDSASTEPITAHFVGHRLMPSRATAVRVVGRFNLKDSATAAAELVRARVHFLPGVGGRAVVLATEGDVPAGRVYVGAGCWDAQEQEGYAILRSCERGVPPSAATCVVLATRGAPANCRLGELPLPPEDLSDASPEADAPASDVVAPTAMPSGT